MKTILGMVAAVLVTTSTSSSARDPLLVELYGRTAFDPSVTVGGLWVGTAQYAKRNNVVNIAGRAAPLMQGVGGRTGDIYADRDWSGHSSSKAAVNVGRGG